VLALLEYYNRDNISQINNNIQAMLSSIWTIG